MAVGIGSVVSNEIIIDLVDTTGEPGRVSIPMDGATSDADLESVVTDYALASNAFVVANLVRKYPFTGIVNTGKPATTGQSLIAAVLAMDFQKVNPLNAAKTVNKQVVLAAYLDALRNDAVTPHVPVTGNANLNALIALLEAGLDYVGADGAHYPGGWTFNPSSKFGTKLTVTDGL